MSSFLSTIIVVVEEEVGGNSEVFMESSVLSSNLLVFTASFKIFSMLLTISNFESTLTIRSLEPTAALPIVRTTCPFKLSLLTTLKKIFNDESR